MKNLLILLGLVFCLNGCSHNIEFVKPPLQDPPLLESVKVEPSGRFSMDRHDFEHTMMFFQHVRNVKAAWQ